MGEPDTGWSGEGRGEGGAAAAAAVEGARVGGQEGGAPGVRRRAGPKGRHGEDEAPRERVGEQPRRGHELRVARLAAHGVRRVAADWSAERKAAEGPSLP